MYTNADAVEDKVNAGQREIVLDRYASTSAGIYLYYPQRSQVHPKLRAFIEHIKSHPKPL